MTIPFNNQSLSAIAPLSNCGIAFFVSCEHSWPNCLMPANPRGRRNFSAMRDQHFQDLMSKFNDDLRNDGPGNVNDPSSYYSNDEAKASIEEELNSQLPFKQFLKRSLPNRKPSSAFIKSIKDRIKIIETPDSSI